MNPPRNQVASILSLLALLLWGALPSAAAWRSLGPDGANVNAVVFKPGNPQTVYAATRRGVFASVDGGASWKPSSRGLPVDRAVYALAIDPGQPSTLYAAMAQQGVFKSVNGGATWIPARQGLELNADLFAGVLALAAPSRGTGVIYAGTGEGPYKTVDGGAHWRSIAANLTSFDIRIVLADPAARDTLWATVSGSGVWQTVDGGASWRPAHGGTLAREAVTALARDPRRPGTLWAGTSERGVFQTTDGGAHWRPAGLADSGAILSLSVVSAGRRSFVWAGTRRGLFRLGAGGAWMPSGPGLVGSVLALAQSPASPGVLYAGTTGKFSDGTPEEPSGVFQSRNGGATWIFRSRGMAALGVTAALQIQERDTEPKIWAGIEGIGLYRSAHDRWARQASFPGTHVAGLAVNTADRDTFFALAESSLYRTRDGGRTWQGFGLGGPGSAVMIAPGDPFTLYVAGARVFRSTDLGATFTRLEVPELGFAQSLAVATPRLLYLAGWTPAGPAAPDEPRVWRSADAGATWTRIDAGLPAGGAIALAAGLGDAGVLYAGATGGVWKSEDRGDHWTLASDGLPDPGDAAAAFAVTSGPVYASLGSGIWKSDDSGATWRRLGEPPPFVTALAVEPFDPDRLYAGSYLSGVFVYEP
jgi:photosystem II stability/assembly factor-like uncharacterized protein